MLARGENFGDFDVPLEENHRSDVPRVTHGFRVSGSWCDAASDAPTSRRQPQMRSALREAARRGRESVGGGRAKPSPGRLDPRSSFLVPLGPRTTADVDLDQTTRGTEGCGQWHVQGKALPCLAYRARRSESAARVGRARGMGCQRRQGGVGTGGRPPRRRGPPSPPPVFAARHTPLEPISKSWPWRPPAPLDLALLHGSCGWQGGRGERDHETGRRKRKSQHGDVGTTRPGEHGEAKPGRRGQDEGRMARPGR